MPGGGETDRKVAWFLFSVLLVSGSTIDFKISSVVPRIPCSRISLCRDGMGWLDLCKVFTVYIEV